MSVEGLSEAFAKLLAEASSSALVRKTEESRDCRALWAEIEASGFLDALIPDSAGGAGLSLAEVHPILQLLGRYTVPAPVGETMVARALAADAGVACPDGPIALAIPVRTSEGWRAAAVTHAAVAENLLVDDGQFLHFVPVGDGAQGTGIYGCLAADFHWPDGFSGATLPRPASGLRAIAALVRAAAISGAGDALLERTVEYAGTRVQFGKPIANQQAVQQQLAVMAEQVVMARIASQIGCAQGFPAPLFAAATAKQVTSAAADQIARIAHGVHGAIGMTAEYDLQLYTRRIQAWRVADGSETYWAQHLGENLGVADADIMIVDHVRRSLS
jgi:acyl-CoA dehydrogenase